jgi:uracil-DNA glycosylase
MATYHPSALLRAADEASRASMERDLLADLVLARQRMAASAA